MKNLFVIMLILFTSCYSGDAAEVKVCFVPGGNCKKEIIDEIDKAEVEILVQTYIFTDAELADALIRAYNRHVNVLVIYDKRYIGKKGDKVEQLTKAGIMTIQDPTSGIAHNKIMVIDRNTTLTGSYNFSEAADKRNVENVVTIQDAKIAHEFVKNWFSRYTASITKDEKVSRGDKVRNSKNS